MIFTHASNGPYFVKRLDTGPRFTQVAAGFPRRSAGWAWLIDWANTHGYEVFFHETDAENDAIDAMLLKDGMLYQYAVERNKA
jgi:hypothetical protein